ncbi:MAG TPA: hypothetical protein ENF29_01360 [Candidatus Acetothermia bacterium]|nr:hypothetical protein [Candidatus Acetothermia bacterium]
MRNISSTWMVKAILLVAALGVVTLTGCDLLDQLFGGTPPSGGTGDAPTAVITARIADQMVDRGDNPDHRPPISYVFSALDSLDKFGDPIRRGIQEVAWDFSDGGTRGFEWNDYTTRHLYYEEGTYTVTLTVREPETYGNATDTAQKTITIGPGWLKIDSVTTTPRQDGQFKVTIAVHNQSNQALKRITVALLDDNGGTARGADVTLETPLAPNGAYTFTTVIGGWTGTLRAIPLWCYPPSAG